MKAPKNALLGLQKKKKKDTKQQEQKRTFEKLVCRRKRESAYTNKRS
jgi:hypothetical protein